MNTGYSMQVELSWSNFWLQNCYRYCTTYGPCDVLLCFLLLHSSMYGSDIIIYYTFIFGKSMFTHLPLKLHSSSVPMLLWLSIRHHLILCLHFCTWHTNYFQYNCMKFTPQISGMYFLSPWYVLLVYKIISISSSSSSHIHHKLMVTYIHIYTHIFISL